MFLPSGAAAAAGSKKVPYGIRGARCLGTGGFSGTVPAGWTLTRTSAGEYSFVHDGSANAKVIVMPDAQNAGTEYMPAVNRLSPSPVLISTRRVGDGGVLDGSFWVYVIDMGPNDNGSVIGAQVSSTGAFVGGTPAGWSILKTGQGLYTLTVDWNTDARYVANPANWCFFVPVRGQTNGAMVNGTPNIGPASVQYVIETIRLADGNKFDQMFFIVAVKSGERGPNNRLQVASVAALGTFTPPTPTGWTITRPSNGVYTLGTGYGESIDPRQGSWGAWASCNRLQANQAVVAIQYSGNNVVLNTQRPIDFGIENKSFWPVVFKVNE